MADFLTRLASRAMGLAPVVEPVVGSLFAPEPAIATVGGFDVALNEARRPPEMAMGQDTLPLPSAPLPESAYRSTTERQHPEPTHAASPNAHNASEPDRRVVPSTERGQSVVSAPAATQPQRATAGETAAEDTLLLPPSGPAMRALPVGPSRRAVATLSVRPTQSDRGFGPTAWLPEEPAGAPEQSSKKRVDEASAPRHEMTGAPLLMPLAPAESPPPSRQNAPRRRGEHGQVATTALSPAPSPTIEITIGRVEVRAVHPPAPATRPKPASPPTARVSLEDYLRDQQGRGR